MTSTTIITTTTVDDAAATQALVDSLCGDVRCYLRIPSNFQCHHILQLAQAIKTSSVTVTHLEIAAGCQAETCLSILFDELNSTLTQLQVEEPTRELMKCILKCIGITTSLTTLAVCGGMPAHTTLSNLIDALLSNSSILVLDLSRNDIGNDDDLELLANLLQHSSTLKCVMLHDNRIVNLDSIAKALQHNISLRMLSLADNGIQDLKPLAQVLESCNFCLERMYLHGNRFKYSCEERSRISHYLELNTAGRRLLHGQDEVTAGLYPCILGRVSDNPSLLFGLLRELPQAWTRS
jgi:hypothetical protein